jgi:hypothetical protein
LSIAIVIERVAFEPAGDPVERHRQVETATAFVGWFLDVDELTVVPI